MNSEFELDQPEQAGQSPLPKEPEQRFDYIDTAGPLQIKLADPLSEVTRKERTTLLAVSATGIGIVKTGFVPSKIAALGIEFSQTDKRALLLSIAATICYFVVAFSIYAIADYLNWSLSHRSAILQIKIAHAQKRPVTRTEKDWLQNIVGLVRPVAKFRAAFEFLIPLAIGGYAFALLLVTAKK